MLKTGPENRSEPVYPIAKTGNLSTKIELEQGTHSHIKRYKAHTGYIQCSARFRLTICRCMDSCIQTHFFIVMHNLLHRPPAAMLLLRACLLAVFGVAIAEAAIGCCVVAASICSAVGMRSSSRLLLKAPDDCGQPPDTFLQICICG